MTKQEAETRLNEILRAWSLFKDNQVPNGYELADKQPTMYGEMATMKLYKPKYTEAEKLEIAQLKAIIEQE